MKKTTAILLSAAILLGVCAVLAVGGTSVDPLISWGFIKQNYIPETLQKTADQTEEGLGGVYAEAREELDALAGDYLAQAGGEGYAGTFKEGRFKRGDALRVLTGSGATLLAGRAEVVYEDGVVIDVTAGETVPSGTAMSPSHFYLAGEDTVCAFTVTSETAVMAPQGYYSTALSSEVDYNELADALKALGLFRGSTTAYGSGYELEMPPTRIQGLIMFLRLIGEEEAALAYQGEVPFSDVPDWCRGYVAYGVAKGYVKGYPNGTFGTQEGLTGQQYITFLLRALGYRDSGETPDFSYENVIAQAGELGVVTKAEQELLAQPGFLRSRLVYFSYYALHAGPKEADDALIAYLVNDGLVDEETAIAVTRGLNTVRME